MGISSYANSARLYKIGRVYSETGNYDLSVLEVQADFSEMSEVKKVSVTMQGGRKMGTIESAIANLKAMLIRYLDKAGNMFPGVRIQIKGNVDGLGGN